VNVSCKYLVFWKTTRAGNTVLFYNGIKIVGVSHSEIGKLFPKHFPKIGKLFGIFQKSW
jgi:hypothetical protein